MKDKNAQDNMGYIAEGEKLGSKNGVLKMKLAAMGLWWIICTLFSAFIMASVSPDMSFGKKAVVCLIEGFVIMLIMYYLVFPMLLGKEKKFSKYILEKINTEGVNHQVAAEIDAHLRTFQKTPTNASYYNSWLIALVGYNVNVMNYGEAMRLLDLMDMYEMQRMYKYPTGKTQMVNYYTYRIMAAAGIDIGLMERFYGDASRVFTECRGISVMVDCCIDEANADREIAYGRIDNAEQLIRGIMAVDSYAARLDGNEMLGECAAKRGDMEAANRYFDTALTFTRSDFQRECIERKRSKCMAGYVDKGN